MSAHPRQWSEAEDAELRARYEAGHSWDEIAEAMGVSRCSALARGQRIHCIKPKPPPEPMPQPRTLEGSRCLEPGSPETWLAIIRGTLLEGTPFT